MRLERGGSVRETRLEEGRGAGEPQRMIKPSPFKWFKTSPEIIRLAVTCVGYLAHPATIASSRNIIDLT